MKVTRNIYPSFSILIITYPPLPSSVDIFFDTKEKEFL